MTQLTLTGLQSPEVAAILKERFAQLNEVESTYTLDDAYPDRRICEIILQEQGKDLGKVWDTAGSVHRYFGNVFDHHGLEHGGGSAWSYDGSELAIKFMFKSEAVKSTGLKVISAEMATMGLTPKLQPEEEKAKLRGGRCWSNDTPGCFNLMP